MTHFKLKFLAHLMYESKGLYPKHLARLAASFHAIIPFPEVSKS